MQLDEFAAVDDPQEAGAAKVLEGTGAITPEQGQSIPTERSGTLGPVFG
jgi:hypothetical protein